MPDMRVDVIDDVGGSWGINGWEDLTRGVIVYGLPYVSSGGMIANAVNYAISNGYAINASHPDINNLWVDKIKPRPDKSGANTVHLAIEYNNVPPAARIQEAQARNPAGTTNIQGAAGLQQTVVYVDVNGTTIRDSQNKPAGVPTLKVNPTYVISRQETTSPLTKQAQFSGKINDAAYNGFIKWQLLMEITYNNLFGSTNIWQVNYNFYANIAPNGWKYELFNLDQNGRPIQGDGGVVAQPVIVESYKTVNFNLLNLPSFG
jgi:hypothetical protein